MALRSFLSDHGFCHLTSPPHTPEHNRISERKHRHIVETGLSLLSHASLPQSYWSYAFATAVYLINRMPTPILRNDSPYMKLFGTEPNYLKLRIFGCVIRGCDRMHHKLDPRSATCTFIGYSLSQSAYLCLDKSTGRIYTSRHVMFDETKFPFQLSQSPSTPPAPTEPSTYPYATIVPTRQLVQSTPATTPCLDPHHTTLPSATAERPDPASTSHMSPQRNTSTPPSPQLSPKPPTPPVPTLKPFLNHKYNP